MTTSIYGFNINQHGGPEVLLWQQLQLAPLAVGEVLIRHHAIGVNFIDIYHRQGLYPMALPAGLGLEAAGVVEAVGAGVTTVKPGDRVAYCKDSMGAYAEASIVKADALIPLPDEIDFETAAACLLKGLTAAYLLFKTARLQSGATLLVHAAAGGVGCILTQWASALGQRVIGTVGDADKAVLARRNGCVAVINYRKQDTVAEVKQLTGGRGVEVVFDSVGAATCDISLNVLAKRGLFVSFGNASGAVDAIAPLTLMQKGSLFMTRPALAHYIAERDEMLELAGLLFDAIAKGIVTIQIGQRWPLQQAAQAQIALAGRQTMGSTILLP